MAKGKLFFIADGEFPDGYRHGNEPQVFGSIRTEKQGSITSGFIRAGFRRSENPEDSIERRNRYTNKENCESEEAIC